MNQSLLLSYPENIAVSSTDDGGVVLQTPERRVCLGKFHPATRGIVDRLLPPGASLDQLVESVNSTQLNHGVAHLLSYLQVLSSLGLLRIAANDGHRHLATLVPTRTSIGLIADQSSANHSYALSRFALMRRFGNEVIVESPLSAARVVVHAPQVATMIAELTSAKSCRELAAAHAEFSEESVRQVVQLLRAAQIVVELDHRGLSTEDENVELQSWEFHDLLFHTRSRQGRNDEPSGATFRTDHDPPPAVKPIDDTRAIPLHRPDLDELARSDPPLTEVMERRCSVRQYGQQPMTVDQLGEFLYRVARVKGQYEVDFETPYGSRRIELTSRPYPSGGALYPLEFYPVVGRCQGMNGGLYHYDPRGHQLIPLTNLTQTVEQILQAASYAIGVQRDDLQVLLVIAARFRRVSWKYSGLAYSLVMKEVGAAMQNMYLAATAMQLSPCAIGMGNSDLFAEAVASDYYAETSVGEFALGSLPNAIKNVNQADYACRPGRTGEKGCTY